MQVQDLMTQCVETVRENDSLRDAAWKMKDADAGFIPVTNGDGQVVGVLTDRDIVMRAVAQGTTPKELRVSDVMSSDVVTCQPA